MIGFCVGELGFRLEEALSMTWAEFVIKSRGFQRRKEYEMKMIREVAYETHTLKYMFGKKNPPAKNKFWPIDKEKTSLVSDKAKEVFFRQYYKYKEKLKKDGGTKT